MPNFTSVQNVVAQAALELGLVTQAADVGEDVYTTTDPAIAQLVAFVEKAGLELLDAHNWSHLRQEYTFMTGLQTSGAMLLPLDWRNMIDQSGWNRTTRLPLGGPLSDQEWAFMNARLTGVVLNVLFKPTQGMLFLYPMTGLPSGQTINVAYKSSFWVANQSTLSALTAWSSGKTYGFGDLVYRENSNQPFTKVYYRCVWGGVSVDEIPDSGVAVGASGLVYSSTTGTPMWNQVSAIALAREGSIVLFNLGTSSAIEASADAILFDKQLMVSKLKLIWLDAKGFDTTSAERDFNRTFDSIVGNDVAAPKLSLTRGGVTVDRLLGEQNIPITGFGG